MATDQSMQKHTIDETALQVTSIFTKTGEHAVLDHTADADEEILVALGYKQEFKRSVSNSLLFASALNDVNSDFTWIESFSVSFSVLGLLPSVASTLGYNLGYSGQAGSIWGWIVAGVMIQSVVFGMAELCSSMPTAGGLYYASAVLAPEGWGPFASWVSCGFKNVTVIRGWKLTTLQCVGWSNFLGKEQ
jgi:amino acid transporter